MKKICFFDIDGTLTHEDGGAETPIPESCREALELAHKQGILLFVNTGRPYSTLSKEILSLPFDGFVCAGGTWIMMNNEVLYQYELKEDRKKELIERLNQLPFACVYEGYMGVAVNNIDYHAHASGIINTYRREKFKFYDCSDEKYTFEKFCLFKLSNQSWGDLSFIYDYQFVYRDDNFFEVIPKECSKGNGILFLLKHLNISMENCYCFADSENDLNMLSIVRNSIVMGHAIEVVKKQARWIAPKPSEDGIYKMMKELKLIEVDDD